MDPSSLRTMLDAAKCSNLSMEEKRELVYELSNHPDGTPEMLQSWSRQDILQLLCSEMGKERKYTGLTKLKIIENLFKIITEKSSQESFISDSVDNSTPKAHFRKPDYLSDIRPVIYCKNSACKANLSPQDVFCKRCSCCICRKYDDNKDPSLWLTCSSESPFEGESCNMSCHLECALKHERSGLSKMGQVSQLDGSFYCVSCGKMNDLLTCWKKQLMIARDTRRVDILCYRVSLSQKLLSGTNKYQQLSDIVDEAVTMLQAEVGPLTDITVKMGRGIVNRMCVGQQVQKLCASAVELVESMLSETKSQTLTRLVGQVSRTSTTGEPSCTLSPPGTRVVTEEIIEMAPQERSHSPVTNCSTLSNPSSVEDEMNTPLKTRLEIVPCPPPEMALPTPSRTERNGMSKSSKKRRRESEEDSGNEDLEMYVKVIRSLECEGHIETSFRKKLLSWYSLRATTREMHAVQVFVNAFRDDPASLAEQLIDAFEDIVSGQSSEIVTSSGFCMKLWH